MTESQRFRLGALCRMEKGTSPTLKTEPGQYPLVVTAEFRRSSDMYQFDCEAVCVPLISSTGHGNAALHRVHYENGRFALANLLVALIPFDSEICETKYLYYLLQAKRNELLVPLMQGTANVSLKQRDIAGVEVSLPPLYEQRRIVAKIESLAAKIDEARQLREGVLTDAEALLSSVFARLIEGADHKPMAEVAPIVRRPVEIEPDGEYPELGVRSFGRGTFHKPALNGIEVGTKRLFRIHEGDLVLSNVFAWEGAIAVASRDDDRRVGSHRFITCAARDGVTTSEFLRFYLLTNDGIEKIREASPGGAGRNRTLGLKKLEKIQVPIPDYDKQLEFNRLQARVASIRRAQADNQTELDALLPAILDHAFKGEL